MLIALLMLVYFVVNTFNKSNKEKVPYYEGPTIYKDVALQFSRNIVAGRFIDAHKLLSRALKLKYSPQTLADTYVKMIEYFDTDNVSVNEEFVIREGDSGDKEYIYVPIDEPGNSEAIAVKVDYENNVLCITELDWGRP